MASSFFLKPLSTLWEKYHQHVPPPASHQFTQPRKLSGAAQDLHRAMPPTSADAGGGLGVGSAMRRVAEACPGARGLASRAERAGRRLLARSGAKRASELRDSIFQLCDDVCGRGMHGLAVEALRWGEEVAVRAGDPEVSVTFHDQELAYSKAPLSLLLLEDPEVSEFSTDHELPESDVNAPLSLLLLGARGGAHAASGELGEAEGAFRQALERGRASLGPDTVMAAAAADGLAKVLVLRGNEVEAEVHACHAAGTLLRLAPDSRVACGARLLLGNIIRDLGRPAEALPHLRGASDVLEEKGHEDARDALMNTVDAAAEAKEWAQCNEACMRWLALDGGSGSLEEAIFLSMQTDALIRLERYDDSEPTSSRAALLCHRHLGRTHYSTVWAIYICGMVATERSRLRQAEHLLRRALLLALKGVHSGEHGWGRPGEHMTMVKYIVNCMLDLCDLRDEAPPGEHDPARTARMREALLAGGVPPAACATCGAEPQAPKGRCGPCGAAFYCSKACQRRHWHKGGHREECPQWRWEELWARKAREEAGENGQ